MDPLVLVMWRDTSRGAPKEGQDRKAHNTQIKVPGSPSSPSPQSKCLHDRSNSKSTVSLTGSMLKSGTKSSGSLQDNSGMQRLLSTTIRRMVVHQTRQKSSFRASLVRDRTLWTKSSTSSCRPTGSVAQPQRIAADELPHQGKAKHHHPPASQSPRAHRRRQNVHVIPPASSGWSLQQVKK